MTATRHSLQRELFSPNDERLIDLVNVVKATKKKKISLLCAVISNDKPVRVTIYQVKNSDKDVYKKRSSWILRELKQVDGKDGKKDVAEFDLYFDRVYKWQAVSIPERNTFIKCLWRLCSQFLPRHKPTFVNIPKMILEGGHDTFDSGITPQTDDKGIVDVEDYQALTQREESDLENLMVKYEFAISNAEAFTEQLARELATLDATNVHTIMESEQRVQGLMEMIQGGIDQVSQLERRLDAYDDLLTSVRDSVLRMEEKDAVIHIQNKNNEKLLKELENLIGQFDLPHHHQMALLNGDLKTQEGIAACTAAAKALEDIMTAQVHPATQKMNAVSEQQRLCDKLNNRFGTTLSHHLNNLFVHLGNESNTLSYYAQELTLTKHTGCHNELLPYTQLMLWLKNADQERYEKLTKVYISSLSKLYEKEIKCFFELAKERLLGKGSGDKDKKNWTSGSNQDLGVKQGAKPRSFSLLGMASEQSGSDTDLVGRGTFDSILERILSMLEPVCLAEQEFCVNFFGLSSKMHLSTSHSSAELELPASNLSRASSDEFLCNVQRKEKLINEEVRKMMSELFSVLEPELTSFMSAFDKIDGFYSMYLLVRLSQHVMSTQDTGSFLSMTFASALVQAKRNFDKFMKAQIKSIEEAKASKKSKCGILVFITNFEEFANQAEHIFKGSERRADLDKWYIKLVRAMFEGIVKIAAEHPRTPQEVVMMENFHHLFTLLYQLKIPCLENERKEAKQKYSEALQAYVTHYFGRPLEKLNLFFEGVQNKVAQGVKEDEVGYQLAFSKQELRKVIKEYPGKEVKKGLESLYKKVEKHLCEEENLLQVVWHSMQDEFIRQYKYIEGLIERCYPGSMISLEFSINDILDFFSDIARSH